MDPNYVHPALNQTIEQLFNLLENVNLKRVIPLTHGLWNLGKKTYLMGILNVTPDSFSDGGKFNSVELAAQRVREMASSGVDIIDIGGQSTRPGATVISLEEELKRVIPVIKALRKEFPNLPLSIDTFYSKVAKEAIEAGVDLVNDVSGGTFDNSMFKVCSQLQVPICIVHSKGNAQTMSSLASYTDVVKEVKEELESRVQHALQSGIFRWNIIIDPGFGFAKKKDHSLELLRNGGKALTSLGYPLLYGTSRKGFIGEITQKSEASERVWGTAATCTAAIQQGADIIRVHDVEQMRDVLLVSDAIYRSSSSSS